MTPVRLHEVIGKVRGRLARDEHAATSDAALLDRFLARQDEDSFAELVRRHGTMVYGVCRRMLRNAHDAEDAFQATFLVLVRSGAAVRKQHAVGSWLYGVARRTALEARRSAARRRVKEAAVMPGSATGLETRNDLRRVLDEEIERLPEKMRAPLLLCDLEGMTRKEAARCLGWPEGTVASRLATARKVLAGRLTRRGVTYGGSLLALAAAGETASATIPPALVSSTVRLAAGRTMLSSGIAALVKGVMMTMLLKKLKVSVALLLAVAVLGTGGSIFRGVGSMEARAADDVKTRDPLAALRHENELLKVNLHVLLEKVHAQEVELQALKGHAKNTFAFEPVKDPRLAPTIVGGTAETPSGQRFMLFNIRGDDLRASPNAPHDADPTVIIATIGDPTRRAEVALKYLGEVKDDKTRVIILQQLDGAVAEIKALRDKKSQVPAHP